MTEPQGDTVPVTSFSDTRLAWSDEGAGADSPPADSTHDPQTPDTATDPSPEAATTPPAQEPTPGEAPFADGPIPLDRHKAILEGERKKLADAEAKWQRVAWAEELASSGKTPEQIREALSLYDGIDADPATFLERFYDSLHTHPQFALQVRSWAAKVLAGGRKPVEAVDPHADPEPGPDFQDEKGTPFFSAPQLQKWHQWQQRQQEARINERIAPLIRDREQAQEQERLRIAYTEVENQVKSDLEAFRQQPYFKEHEADIKAYLAQHEWKKSLADAYTHVLTTKVLPTLKSAERADTLAELKTHAAASTVKPSTAAPATTTTPKSFFDPALKWS